jgi:hypothetical protein
MKKLILVAAVAMCVGFAKPASGPEPNLCDLLEGRYCMLCGESELLPPCLPESDEGWLCCSGGVCVEVASFDEDCSGDVGWCSDYFTETLANGIDIAVCQDSQDD